MDFDILIALAQREAYERYARFIKRSSLSKEAHTLFEAMGEWFKHNPSKPAIEWAGFAAWFTLVRHAKMSTDQQALYKGLLDMLSGRKLSGALDSLMEGLTRRDYFARIGEMALRGADGDYTVTIDSLRDLTEQYYKDVGQLDALERDLGSFALDALEGATAGGLQWRLNALKQSLGPIRQGDLGVFAARPDTGKCLAIGTPVLLADGSVKAVEDVQVGDKLSGVSGARTVLGTTRGRDRMFRITYPWGESYTVNSAHILSLKRSKKEAGRDTGDILNVNVEEYMAWPEGRKSRYKGWKAGQEFAHKSLPMDSYLLGLWLGDGTTTKPQITTTDAPVLEAFVQRYGKPTSQWAEITYDFYKSELLPDLRKAGVFGNKHIPHDYLTSSREQRLELLAGLLDSDGWASPHGYEISTKLGVLKDGYLFLARSLGMHATAKREWKRATNSDWPGAWYWRVHIGSEACGVVPCRLERKQVPVVNNGKRKGLHFGITVEEVGEGEYAGFSLDGDHLFLLGDFTVTHNTTFLASEGTFMAAQLPSDKGVLWINNEEQGNKVRRRIVQAAIGWTVREMDEDFPAALAEYEQVVGNREKILVFDRAKVHTKDVETLCQRHNVGLVIFDQLRKVHGFEQEAEHERQTLLYNWARELAKEHAPVINVTQAGAEGADQKWLGMEAIYGAKCLAPDTEVLMYDGSTKLAKDVELGDSVMGMDSTPRTVLSTTTGREPMYRITHKNGLSYVVNESHILTLRKTQNKGDYGNKGDVLDIPLKVYTASTNMQRHLKGFHVGVEYPQKVLPIDPYILGLWITDGKKTGPEWATTDEEFRNAIRDYAEQEGYTYKEHTDGSCWYPRLKHRQGVPHPFTLKLKELGVWRNKSIPEVYMHGSRNQRLELLAGIIDGDGNKVTRAHVYYDVYSESLALAQSVQRLAHSVGLNATVRPKKHIFRVHVSGDVADIPVRIWRKKTNYRSAHKDVTTSSLRIEPLGEGDYAGFTVDGDSRYVLGNHIVTHNTGPQGEADFVITMGRRLADGNKRYIYIPKNKLQTPGDPSQRNGRWEVEIEGDTATWKEPRTLPR